MADSMAEIQAKVAARVEAEKRANPPEEKTGSGGDAIDLGFVSRCFLSNEVGDSMLYNLMHRGKYIYNVVTTRWMKYTGPHWEIDYNGESLADCEAVVVQYLRLMADADQRLEKLDPKEDKNEFKSLQAYKKRIIARFDRLRSGRGRRTLLDCCATNAEPITVHPDQLDKQPWLFACKNGVVDLRTGEFREHGSPEDYLTLAAPTEWRGLDEPAPWWDRFLRSILEDEQDVIDFLLRALGYSITGLNVERIFIVLFGQYGQNGKGTLMEILYHVLGGYAGPIQSEMLMSQRFSKGSSGPSPDLMALKGRRLAWASESEEGQSFAAGKIKLFSGGDPLVGRGLNDKDQTTFFPSHTLYLLTNAKPHAPAHDSAFWERIKVIDFPLSFVRRKPELPHERLADPDLLDNLKGEASGILASLVRSCIEWQKKGMAPPEKVLADTLQYRRDEDDMQDFLDKYCTFGADERASFSGLYTKYKEWWEEVATSRPMSKKKFGTLLSLKYKKVKSGKMYYLGLSLRLVGELDD